IAPSAQAETGNLAVKVRFPNKDVGLRLNTVARVEVQTQPDTERWIVPEAALLEDQEPPAVIVAEEVAKKNAEGKEEKVTQARSARGTYLVEPRLMFNLAAKARPYFGAVVLSTVLFAAGGIYSVTRMPSAIFPEITFPRIAVVAKKPGLDLRSMELQVTVPLEQAVSTVIGVEKVRSKTIRGGCDLSIEFSPGTEMKRAEQLTWNRIGAARSSL